MGRVKKYCEECQTTVPQTTPSFSESAKEIHELHKRINELEKDFWSTLAVKASPHNYYEKKNSLYTRDKK